MKNSILLAVGTALLVTLAVGCKTKQPTTTPLPNAAAVGDGAGTDGQSGRRTPPLNINTSPNPNGVRPVGEGVTGNAIPTGDLPDPDKLAGRPEDRVTFSGQTVLFDFDRANVKASEAPKVSQVATRFKALPAGHDLLIEGHCDERGTEGYNQALGERRALAIREMLMHEGISGDHLFTKSLGKDHPVDPGHNEAAWGKNRRGEFVLVLPKKITTTQNSQ